MIVYTCPRCGNDLEEATLTVIPPIHTYRCRNCGWYREEREAVIRKPFDVTEETESIYTFASVACSGCPNYKPGVACNCILGEVIKSY